MDAFIKWVKEKTDQALAVPTAVVGSQFIVELLLSLRDGQIDNNEWLNLTNSANGLEFASLALITFVLRYIRKGK